MALQRQIVSVPFTGSLNQKVNSHLLPLQQFRRLTNCYQDKQGELRIRNGVVKVGGTPGPAGGAAALASIGGELVQTDGQTLRAWGVESGAWRERGRVVSCDVSVQTIFGGLEIDILESGLAVVNAAETSGYVCYVGKSTGVNEAGTCRVVVVEQSTGSVVFNDVLPDVLAAGDVTVVASGANRFTIAYVSAANPDRVLYVDLNNVGTGSIGFGSPTGIAGGLSATAPRFDFVFDASGTQWFVAFVSTSGDLVVEASAWGGSPLSIAGDVTNVSVGEFDAAGDWLVFYRDDITEELLVSAYDKGSRTQTLSPVAVAASPGPGDAHFDVRLSVLEHPSGPSTRLVWSQPVSNVHPLVQAETMEKEISWSGSYDTSATATTVSTNASLTGRPFVDDTLRLTVVPVVNWASEFGHTGTLMFVGVGRGDDPCVIGRCFVHRAPSRISSPLPRTIRIDPRAVLFPFLRIEAGSLQNPSGVLYRALCSLVGVTLDLSQKSLAACEANGLLLIAGGLLYFYDGIRTAECGVLISPGVTAPWGSIDGGLNGALSAGDYSFGLTFLARDAKGNEHYSGVGLKLPSVVITADPNAGLQNISINPMGPCLTQHSVVDTVVYRTVANGTLHYVDEIFYDTKKDSWGQLKIGDNADTKINTNAVLYTDAGEVEHVCPPTPYCIASDADVILLVPGENRREIWMSLPVRRNLAPAFSEQLVFVMPTGDDLTAVAFMDSRPVWFREGQIGYLVGTPPAASGLGGYSEARTVIPDNGAEDFRSLVHIPAGIIFKGSRGFYLLGRDFSVSYIGAPVEDYNDQAVNASVLHSEREQAWFAMSGGDVLVFDYEKSVWSVFTFMPGSVVKDLAIVGGVPHLLMGNGAVYAMPPDEWRDAGELPVVATARTGWAALSGLVGFERLYRIALLGKTHAGPEVKTRIQLGMFRDYDYESAPVVLYDNTSNRVQPLSDRPVEMRVHNPKQKCSSAAFEIKWWDENAAGRAVSWSGLALEIGQKRGLRKLPPTGSF